jgi:putative membrane protein
MGHERLSGTSILSRTFGAVLAMCIVALGACSTATEKTIRAAGAGPVQPLPRPTPKSSALSPASYFSEATAIDLFQLRAADIAMQHGSGRARSVALEAKRQHQAISAQMSFAGRYLNLLPSRSLPPEYQQMLSTLLSGADFNGVYLAQQRVVLARALKLHSNFAERGQSPTLRPVAQFASVAVQSELQVLGR